MRNQIFINRFGEDVTFTLSNATLTLKAIVERENFVDTPANTKINNEVLVLNVLQNADSASISRRDSVSVRGKNYSVVEIGDDLDGFTMIRIARA
jgi:hypothetical protein